MQRLRRRSLGLATAHAACLTAALAAGLSATAVSAAGTGSLMILVDGSGSMAGPIEPKGRQSKMALARDALRAALGSGSQSRIGLAAFGHRRGSCNDVEVMRAPASLDLDALAASLAQLKPRGKGPIAFALREAAKQLPEEQGSRSILLIHDGADNCQQDVCAAAAELASAGVTAHVVSLGVAGEDLAKIACVPQATGGRHFKADTSDEVGPVIAEAVRAAGGEPTAIGLAPAVSNTPWSTTVVPPQPLPATGPSALHLRALVAPHTEPLSMPLQWTVARADDAGSVVFDSLAVNPVVPITPGQYVVAARSDLVSASMSVTVREGRPIAVPMMLGAGTLRVRAIAHRTSAPLADALITVAAADGKPLTVLKGGEGTLLLPPGRFRVSAELGLVRAEQTVAVAEGHSTPLDLGLNVGRILLTVAGREGAAAPSDAALFVVMEDDPPRGRREVARSAASQAEFALPPGTYYVAARQGGVEARERLEIGAGDIVRRSLGAPVGRLSLSTSVPLGQLSGSFVSYSVRRIDDPDQETIVTSQPTPMLALPAGRYRVEGRYGLTNVSATREVEIKAGQTAQLSIEHQPATLRLRLAGMGAALADISWEVRDEAGRTVWTSGQADDSVVVQPGRYLVTSDRGEKREERNVELRAGDVRLVEVRAE